MRPFNSSLILSLRAEALSAPPRPRATQRLRAPRRPRARRRLVGCALLTEASAMRPFNSSLILSLRAEALSALQRPRATQRLRAPRRPRARQRLFGCVHLTEASAMRLLASWLVLSRRAEAVYARPSDPARPCGFARLNGPRARRRLVGCALLTEASAVRPFNSSLILSLRAEALSAPQRPRTTQRVRASRRPRARQPLFGCVHLTKACAMRLLSSWLMLSRRAESLHARPSDPARVAGSVRVGDSLVVLYYCTVLMPSLRAVYLFVYSFFSISVHEVHEVPTCCSDNTTVRIVLRSSPYSRRSFRAHLGAPRAPTTHWPYTCTAV